MTGYEGDAGANRADATLDGGTERMPGAGSGHHLVKRCTLTIVDGAGAGRCWTSRGPRVVIGTHEAADLVLDDRAVSRFHCEIQLQDSAARVRDLGSMNGTRVDGVRVDSAYLAGGSVLSLGRTRVRFDQGAGHVKVPVSAREQLGDLVGRSLAMRTTFAALERAAHSAATVLLTGETGTGKEAAAEAIHREGARSGGPFIVVDCGAIPPELLESELFGHEKGAFTGAVSARAGAFEAAHGGTIFLDEIGELGLELQPRLLRVLERRHVKRVGATSYRDVDVRVIAATNRDLRAEVNAKRFRADLYYRLAVVEVNLPPLRERKEDLPVLVDRLLAQLGGAGDQGAALRSDAFLARLAHHPWPGNVRELRNHLERCLAMCEPMPVPASGSPGSAIHGDDGGDRDPLDPGLPLKRARERWNHLLEQRYLAALLERTGGNVSAAARAAGVDRAYLHRMLRRHGLR